MKQPQVAVVRLTIQDFFPTFPNNFYKLLIFLKYILFSKVEFFSYCAPLCVALSKEAAALFAFNLLVDKAAPLLRDKPKNEF